MKKSLLILALALVVICAFAGCSKTNTNDNQLQISKIEAGAPTSSAVITDTGISKSETVSHDEVSLSVGNTVYAWCQIEDVDIATNIAVYFVTPSGNVTETEYIAVNRDMNVFAEVHAIESGEFKVIWKITNKDSEIYQFSVI